MQRVLVFDESAGKKHFEMCYQALVCSPYLKANQDRDLATKRMERTLHQALKGISEPIPDGESESRFGVGPGLTVPARRLIGAPQTLTINQPEHELLKKWVEQFCWGGGQPVEDAMDAADWLGAAPSETKKDGSGQ